MEYQHSVILDPGKCKGCTHCLNRCPTEAIRIRDGRAVINASRCIDCGECIRMCPHNAKKASFDKLSSMPEGKYKIALPAPALFGQIENLDDPDFLVDGLLKIGFDDVFEVACAAELVTEYTRRYLRQRNIPLPVISSACPVVVRLVRMRFPTLADNLLPILPPMEIAGMLAREKAKKEHPELKDEDILTVFISPCPAKVSYVKNNLRGEKSSVDMVVSISDVYFELIGAMRKTDLPATSSKTGMVGLSWASSGGEASSLLNDRYLAADGIENVIRVLEDIEIESHPNLTFVELNACPGGCVGGVMAVENPYLCRVRLRNIKRYLPVSLNHPLPDDPERGVPERYAISESEEYAHVSRYDESRKEAIRMMQDVNRVFATLP